MFRFMQQFRLSLRNVQFRKTLSMCFIFGLLTSTVYYLKTAQQLSGLSDGIFSSAVVRGPLSPTTAMYLWCHRGHDFEFENYLSVQSILSHFIPTHFVFYYLEEPSTDKWKYNSWFSEFRAKIGVALNMEPVSREVCVHPDRQKEFIMKALIGAGGLFVGTRTIVTPQVASLAMMSRGSTDMLMNLNDEMQGFVYVPASLTKIADKSRDIPIKYFKTLIKHCVDVNKLDQNLGLLSESCCARMGPSMKIYPKDIVQLDNKFGSLARMSMYGSGKAIEALQKTSSLVPKVTRYWLGRKEATFLFYLSVLSQLFVLEADQVIVYGKEEPIGENWDRLKKYDKVKFHPHEDYINMKETGIDNNSLRDKFRSAIMYYEGGIYCDPNTIFVKSIDNLRGFDAVLSPGIGDDAGKFPEYFHNGAALGKPGATFWKSLKEAGKRVHTDLPGYYGRALPYKIWELDPSIAHKYPYLVVGRRHGKWMPNWVDPNDNRTNSDSDFLWKVDANALHFEHPLPLVLESEDNFKHANGTTDVVYDIVKLIYKRAGIAL